MSSFSYLKVFPAKATPGQHGGIFSQTRPLQRYAVAALKAPEELVVFG